MPRVACEWRGVKVTRWDGVELNCRLTKRYEQYVAHLCDLMPVLDVAELEGLDKGTVYQLDRKWLQRRQQQRLLREVPRLGIDEMALKRGHKYATVFYDLERREVIGMCRGASNAKLVGFSAVKARRGARRSGLSAWICGAPILTASVAIAAKRWWSLISSMSSVSEGINNTIKVIKRRSYGFHDFQYFYLKILNATGALPSFDAVTHKF